MLFLFKQIRQKLLSENKFARYLLYALGEIPLVVLGILIALQFNNWNIDRMNREKERKYLVDLKSDFEKTKLELEILIKNSEEFIANSDTLLNIIRKNHIRYEQRPLDSLFISAPTRNRFEVVEGVINDILGSGQLDLIKNDSIRRYISSWEANLSSILSWENYGKRAGDNILFYLYDNFNVANWSERLEVIPKENRTELFANVKLQNYISDKRLVDRNLNNLYQEKYNEIDLMIDYIDEYLEDMK